MGLGIWLRSSSYIIYYRYDMGVLEKKRYVSDEKRLIRGISMELIDNAKVQKFHFQGNFQQTLAGADQGLKTLEVWRLSVARGHEIPANRHQGEVVVLTLRGTGHLVVDGEQVDIRPDTTLVIPAGASRQVVNTGKEDLVLLLIRGLVTG
jgi:mannose-6-phosphate isomerase-like protein (cupin superfamily)